jgi:hypothetical protein
MPALVTRNETSEQPARRSQEARMKNHEAEYVGCVMGWETDLTPYCNEPFTFLPPVVTEFCPGYLRSGKIQPTGRMIELAVAGFKPVAIVYCDPTKSDCYSLLAHYSVSESVHQHLLKEAEAIIRSIADHKM